MRSFIKKELRNRLVEDFQDDPRKLEEIELMTLRFEDPELQRTIDGMLLQVGVVKLHRRIKEALNFLDSLNSRDEIFLNTQYGERMYFIADKTDVGFTIALPDNPDEIHNIYLPELFGGDYGEAYGYNVENIPSLT